MNTGMTVTSNAANSLQWTSGASGDFNSLGYCYGCSSWPCQCYHRQAFFPFAPTVQQYVYTISSPDKAALLKAWLDGFMTDRKVDAKALDVVRKKLEEFCDRS